MFEVVKLIVETLSKFLDPKEISTLARERGKRELGTELFLLYAALNEIVSDGDRIVAYLETYCQRMEQHLNNNDDAFAHTEDRSIEKLLAKQSTNILQFQFSVEQLCEYFQIIDANSYRKLMPLLDSKSGALRFLMNHLGWAMLPVNGPTEALLKQVLFNDDENDAPLLESLLTRKSAITKQLDDGSLTVREPWGEQEYKIVKTYLSTRNPRLQLDEIAEVAGTLKTSLENHFSVSDILLNVRDRRLDRRLASG